MTYNSHRAAILFYNYYHLIRIITSYQQQTLIITGMHFLLLVITLG